MKTSDVLSIYKTKAAIAKDLGITKSAVSRWGEKIPVRRIYELNELMRKKKKSYYKACQQKDEPISQQGRVIAVCSHGKYRNLDDIQREIKRCFNNGILRIKRVN